MVLCLYLTACPDAWAQNPVSADERTRPPEPYTPLFGDERSELTKSLDVRGRVVGLYDDLGKLAAPEHVETPLTRSGAGGRAFGTVAFHHSGDRVRARAAGSASILHYHDASDPMAAYAASGSVERRVGRSTDISVAGGRTYAPFFGFSPFFGSLSPTIDPLDPGMASSDLENTSDRASVAALHRLTKRTSVSADASGERWRFDDRPSMDGRTWSVGASLSHNLSRALRASVTYARTEALYGQTGALTAFRRDNVSGGLDYADSVTFARRTSLAFGTSTAAIREEGTTRFRLNGQVTLSRAFARTWNASAGYVRASDFRSGFAAPLLYDSVRGDMSGRLARRVAVSGIADYSTGTIGFSRAARFHAARTVARLDVAVTTTVGVYAEYGYYRSRMAEGGLRSDLPERFARQRIATGVSVWVPLVTEKRVPRDSR